MGRSGVLLVLTVVAATPASAQQRSDTLPRSLAAELTRGGLVVACRHGITDHEFRSDRPHSFADPSTQRTLTAEGEEQMRSAGTALRSLGLRFTDVRASPYHRNVRSAELLFGFVTADVALLGSGEPAAKRALFAPPLERGENRAIVTHQAVLRAEVPGASRTGIEEGDCLVIRPTADGPVLVAHLSAGAWNDVR